MDRRDPVQQTAWSNVSFLCREASIIHEDLPLPLRPTDWSHELSFRFLVVDTCHLPQHRASNAVEHI